MKRALAVLALAATACACGTGPDLDDAYSAAQSDLRRGDLAAAAGRIDPILEGRGLADDAVWMWRFHLLRADLLISRLEMDAAQALLEAPLPADAEFDALRARQQYLLGRVLTTRGQLTPAAAAIEEALTLAPDDASLRLDADILTSQIQFRTGQWTAAEANLADVVARAALAGDNYRRAQALNNLGMGLLLRSRFDEAVSWFEQVLALDDVRQTTIYGQALNNAGICYARLGQFEKAVAAQERAVEIHRGGRRLDYQQALGELGSTYFLQDDIETSITYLQQALTIAAEADIPADASLWARNLAAASIALGEWDEAARYNDEASRFATTNEGARRAFALVTSAQIAAGRGETEAATRLFDEALAISEDVPAVRWLAHDELARLAVAANRPDDAARHFEAAVATVAQARSALLRADYRLSFPTRLIRFYRGYVDLLLREGQVDRALEIADSSRGRVLAERQSVAAPPTPSAAALRRLAREARTVLLFYWLGPDASHVWVVTGDRIRVVTLPPEREITALVAEHQSTLQNAMADPLSEGATAGARLFEMLVAPIAADLPRGSTVTIVPDGSLHRVNFETLTTGTPKRYWIEDVTIQVAPSLAMLERQGARPGSASVLLVGNPEPRAPEFPALSYAPAEMASVARHFAGTMLTRIEGERASPASFRDAQPGTYSVIHFTAHAVANTESPLDSAVILSGSDREFKLYARDVAALGLTADLVTVSACRSAGERAYAGEGLVGFAWAFLRAGSRRVVAGLWDVDDRSTAVLMDHMYAAVANGTPTAVALRQAKLRLIKNGFPKPYYWAPFQVFTVVL